MVVEAPDATVARQEDNKDGPRLPGWCDLDWQVSELTRPLQSLALKLGCRFGRRCNVLGGQLAQRPRGVGIIRVLGELPPIWGSYGRTGRETGLDGGTRS